MELRRYELSDEAFAYLADLLPPNGRRGPVARREKNVAGEPEDHALGHSRDGFGTKPYLAVDSHGIPLGGVLRSGQAHESRSVEPLLSTTRFPCGPGRRIRPRRTRTRLAGDKGYS